MCVEKVRQAKEKEAMLHSMNCGGVGTSRLYHVRGSTRLRLFGGRFGSARLHKSRQMIRRRWTGWLQVYTFRCCWRDTDIVFLAFAPPMTTKQHKTAVRWRLVYTSCLFLMVPAHLISSRRNTASLLSLSLSLSETRPGDRPAAEQYRSPAARTSSSPGFHPHLRTRCREGHGRCGARGRACGSGSNESGGSS